MKIINSIQEEILKNFSKLADSDQFYLTGGTALANFYLKHRQSNDLDFFTSIDEIIGTFSLRLEHHLKLSGLSCERRKGLHSFVELIATSKTQKTMIHLARDSAFRFEPTQHFPGFPGLKVDSLKDLVSNKLLALFGRATLRDFIDIYFILLDEKSSKHELIADAKRKDPGFDLYWFAVALEQIYAFNQDSADMLLLLQPLDLKKLQTFFDQWRKEIAAELKT